MTIIPSLFLAAFGTFILGKTQLSSTGIREEKNGLPMLYRSPARACGVLFSQLYQKQIAENLRSRYLEPLLKEAGLDQARIVVEKLSDLGFSNNVFRVEVHTNDHGNTKQILVAKVFSDLAKKRLDPNQNYMGQVDEILYREGLGPKIVAHTPDALLMEHIDGQVLTESIIFDTHNDRGLSVCSAVGDALGRLHSLQGIDDGVKRPNMLWHALNVMLSSIDKRLELSTVSGTTWTLAKLQDTIGIYRNRLEGLDIPCVALGHGDFKLSNVMITNTDEIRFIDFELTGTHYRGYDLAKFFRSSKQATFSHHRRRHQEAFWESYHQRTSSEGPKSLSEAVSQLEWEAQLLEPMTWLEAASFFLSMATLDDPSQQDKWNGLAESRLLSFETMKVDVKI
jgi:tRNA A-37 threonylcarbamoyl transferase component Bud32